MLFRFLVAGVLAIILERIISIVAYQVTMVIMTCTYGFLNA
jgi:hypothetical protein